MAKRTDKETNTKTKLKFATQNRAESAWLGEEKKKEEEKKKNHPFSNLLQDPHNLSKNDPPCTRRWSRYPGNTCHPSWRHVSGDWSGLRTEAGKQKEAKGAASPLEMDSIWCPPPTLPANEWRQMVPEPGWGQRGGKRRENIKPSGWHSTGLVSAVSVVGKRNRKLVETGTIVCSCVCSCAYSGFRPPWSGQLTRPWGSYAGLTF